MGELKDIATKAVDMVMKLGASECDVVAANSRYMSAEIEKGAMKQANSVADPGVAIRAFRNGCQGFSSCTGFSPCSIKEAARLAVELAKSGTPDPDFKGLPHKKRPTAVAGLHDPKISKLQSEQVVEMAIELADAASGHKDIYSVNASVAIAECSLVLANSNGFAGSQRLSSFETSIEAVAKSGSDMFSGIDGSWNRRLDRPVIESVGRNAMEHAVRGLKHQKIATGDYPVLLDPLAAGFILATSIGGGANAESIQRKRSYLTGKLGHKIGSEALTITDDPTLEWANGSYSFDGEGTPAREKDIIKEGVLAAYLYDSYAAGKDSVESTGNASRGGSVWSFRKPPSISPSNLVVRPGDSTLDQMIVDTKKGVYLRLTWDYPNLATGELSGLMMESYAIDKGELGGSIRQATIGIGVTDLLSRIEALGKESRDAFGVRTPAIRISSARIGGSD
jgi:PmbA protein